MLLFPSALSVAVTLHAVSASRVQLHARARTVTCQAGGSPARILAYGDSLTAGTFKMDAPDELYPYAPHLEAALKGAAIVRHRGLPGWTAQAMLNSVDDADRGLRGILKKAGINPPVDLAIVLAGTNDIGCYTDADGIIAALVGLHSAAHELGVRTLAVGIPPSAFLARDEPAATTAAEVNERMQAWCQRQPNALAGFEPHPVRAYEPDGGLWSRDGLHLSPEGYRVTGEGLVAAVRRRLEESSVGSSARGGRNIIY
jgi:lysophospholipase L1-like esterase